MKQAIFNMLRPSLPGARVLDLFCGGGALGIEALSAGAASALFVEQGRRTIALLKENLRTYAGRAKVIPGDVRKVIPRLAGEKFDVILADPPYGKGLDQEVLALVSRYCLLARDGTMVLEHSRRDQPALPAGYRLVRTHRYGDTVVSIIRNAECGSRKSKQDTPSSAAKSGGSI